MERYKWSFPFTFIGVIFFLFGVIFVIIAAANIAGWEEFRKDAVSVNATITDIDTHTERRGKKKKTYHDVFVEYEYEGVTYSDELDYYTSGMREGDDVEIYVDPERPSDSRSKPYLVSGIMGLFALIFGGIGAGFLGHEIRRSVIVNRLIAEDKFIYANYSHEEKANVTVNKVRYDQSVFVYDDGSGRKMVFKGEPHHPSSRPYIQGDTMKVYVDMEKDPGKYYVSREK